MPEFFEGAKHKFEDCLGPHFEAPQSPYVGSGVPAAYCKIAARSIILYHCSK
jgi:hypothetical protein